MNAQLTTNETRTFGPRETLFRQGDVGDHAYVIRSGEVEVFRMSNDMPVTLGVVGPGGLLGEVALLNGGTRLANAVALTEVETVRISRETFESYLQDMDGMTGVIVNSLLGYVRTSIDLLDDMLRTDAYTADPLDGPSAP